MKNRSLNSRLAGLLLTVAECLVLRSGQHVLGWEGTQGWRGLGLLLSRPLQIPDLLD